MSDIGFELITADEAKKAELRQNWRDRARTFLRRHKVADGEAPNRPVKKLHRVKSYQWLLALDNSLRVVYGRGLDGWVVTDDMMKCDEPENLPMLSGAADQGSDGLCAESFCKYGPVSINFELVDDDCHGNNNDLNGTITDCGMYPEQKLVELARNAHHGPWGTAARHNEMADSIGEWLDMGAADDCPFLEDMTYDILEDIGELDRLLDDDLKSYIKDLIKHHPTYTNRGDSANSERFMDAARRAKADSKVHTLRAVGFGIMGILGGQLDEKKCRLIESSCAAAPAPAPDAPKVPTAVVAKNLVKDYREATRNNVEVALLVYNNSDIKYRQRLIAAVGEPYTTTYSDTSKRQRSVDGCVQWQIDQCKGAFWDPIVETFQFFQDSSKLEYLGLETEFGPWSRLEKDHPVVQWNDDQASLMSKFIFTMAGKRIRRKLPLLRGWTRHSVMLLDVESVDKTIALFKRDVDNFEALKKSKDAFVKKIVTRSLFQSTPVKHMRAVLAKFEFKNSNSVQRWANRKHKRPISSLACEDAGNRARRAEEKSKTNAYSSSLLWETIIKKKVLSGVHKYKEVSGDRQRCPRRSRLPAHLYVPCAKRTHERINIRKIVSYQESTPWPSPGAASLPQNVADLILTEHCLAIGLLGRMRQAWLCSMLKPGHFLIRKKTLGDAEPWLFSLGHVNNVIGLGTPAVERKIEGADETYFLPDISEKARAIHPMPILDGDAVEAMTFECRSPLRLFVERGALAPELGPDLQCIMCFPTCEPDTIYRVMAFECYLDYNLTWCREFGKLSMPGFNAKQPLFQTLKELIEFFLHELDDVQVCAILKKRTTLSFFGMEHFFELEGADDVLSKDEQEKVRKKVQNFKLQKLVNDDYTEEWQEFHRAVHKLPQRAEADPTKADSPLRRYKGPSLLPKGAIPQSELAKLCPPGGHIWEGARGCGSWHVHLPTFPRWSRPWVPFGVDRAAQLVLQYLWVLWLRDNRLLPKHCPVKGLFADDVADVHKDVLAAVVRGVDAKARAPAPEKKPLDGGAAAAGSGAACAAALPGDAA